MTSVASHPVGHRDRGCGQRGVELARGLLGWRKFAVSCLLASAAGALVGCRGGSERTFSEASPVTTVPGDTGLRRGWDLNGIVGTGQSLSVGVQGTPLRATEPSFHNLKLHLGNALFPAQDEYSERLSLVPLREPIRPLVHGYPSAYPRNIYGETPHTSMASQVTQLVLDKSHGRGDYVTVHTVVGESGQALSVIGKGAVADGSTGVAYARSLFEIRAIARLAKAAKRTFGVAAVVLTHGETDAENSDYERALVQFRKSYDADLPAITGQKAAVPLLLTQQSSMPARPGTLAQSALAAWRASRGSDPGIVCVGPRYQYSYARDAVHLDSLGYDRLGEKYGQAYFETVLRGQPWRPLAPLSARREGDSVRIDFHVPVPPLVWDTELPPAPATPREWAEGRGFELGPAGAPIQIERVELRGNSVLLFAPQAPAGALLVRYAASAAVVARPHGTHRWGQLRDSDPFVGATTRTPQPNYAVSFELEAP